MLSRGRLKHPPLELFDLSIYMYSIFEKAKRNVVHEYLLKHSNIFSTLQNMNSRILT